MLFRVNHLHFFDASKPRALKCVEGVHQIGVFGAANAQVDMVRAIARVAGQIAGPVGQDSWGLLSGGCLANN